MDGQDIYSFVSSYGTWTEIDPDTGEEFSGYNVGARVKVTMKDGSSTILPIVYPDIPGERFYHADFFDGGGERGSGFGTGWWLSQSPLPSSETLTEALFQIELGEITYNEALDNLDWETIAWSDPEAKENMSRYIWEGGVAPPNPDQWSPMMFYMTDPVQTPEPSSGILSVLGLMMIALRRKGHEAYSR